MTGYAKPLPFVHDATRPYWEGTRRHELLLQKCQDCGRLIFYPRNLCPFCYSDQLSWVKASGRGTVYSFTISYRPGSAGFVPDLPYNIAIVELEEGVRMMSSIVDYKEEDLGIGMPVEVVFDDVTPEVTLPRFKPAARAGAQ